jgi:hypothetical protein
LNLYCTAFQHTNIFYHTRGERDVSTIIIQERERKEKKKKEKRSLFCGVCVKKRANG